MFKRNGDLRITYREVIVGEFITVIVGDLRFTVGTVDYTSDTMRPTANKLKQLRKIHTNQEMKILT